ncbi:hypothetical protein QQ045_026381 [Rhodiola kirilowii]
MVPQSSNGSLSKCNSLSYKKEIEAWSPHKGSNVVDFDFEFGRGRVGDEEDLVSIMSFADGIFGNGQVKPLKLPPRLIGKGSSGVGSEVDSPSTRSPSGGFKHAIRRMWADDSDPFEKAAEKVREGRRSRRSGSVSPLGVHQWTINDLNMSEDFSHTGQQSDSSVWSQSRDINPKMINQVAEPRGLAIARKLRPISMDQGNDTIKHVQKRLSPIKEKKHGLEKLFSRTASFGSRCKKWSARANKTEPSQRDVTTVTQYKSPPKMLLCLGFQKAC